ncbi:LEA type 2 family protein [Wenzhouxiangella limi]|uniref:LEA type 2 family protein n=1 Tax=Wenzhouxiangella limi TaxID=2707351 RepID=A0A845URZ2_9GAMM|nr:LEA type 2 family protein [Wenzhouxiangella limi]NDY94337.1 LEA type 2 family protein [Wenzhouxiangella limi]
MRALIVAVLLVLTGCASLSPYPDPPTVSVTSFALAPQSTGMTPRFRVGLNVVNPNRRELPLVGMSYSVELEGTRILSGATADLPEVPAYGAADFSVDLSPDLLGSARLLSDLMGRQRDRLSYSFSARLDVGSWLPDIRVEETGSLSLNPDRR